MIPRQRLEDDFESYLSALTPPKNVAEVFFAMVKDSWDDSAHNQNIHKQSLGKSLKRLEKELDDLMVRIVETRSTTLIRALERKIENLEEEKLITEEKLLSMSTNKAPFETGLRTSKLLLSNARKLWDMGITRYVGTSLN